MASVFYEGVLMLEILTHTIFSATGTPSVTPSSGYSATGGSDVIPSSSLTVSTPSQSSSATSSSEGNIVASVDRDLHT